MKSLWAVAIAVLAVAPVGYVGFRAFGSEENERAERAEEKVAAQAVDSAFERAESEENEQGENEQSEQLAKAIRSAKISLQAGLEAASAAGKPISAKFEIDEGTFQLSVYVSKNGAFSEVIVNHRTGKVAKTEAITGGEDLEDAKAQEQAMTTATRSLAAALGEVLAANPGALAVSAVPAVEGGHPVAKVTLAHGENWKIVTVKLD